MDQDTALHLFNSWFVKPIKSSDIDGGFVAFMVMLALYERLIHAKLEIQGTDTGANFKKYMETDLRLTADERKDFWDMFRHGLLHRGMPKVDRKEQKTTTGYIFRSDFSAFPEFRMYYDQPIICIEPAKFAARILDEFVQNPELILRADLFPLASVGPINMNALEKRDVDMRPGQTD